MLRQVDAAIATKLAAYKTKQLISSVVSKIS